MTKKAVYFSVIFLFPGLFLITTCDSFYSNSWGKSREYDTANIKLTVDNLPSWKKAARYNPSLAQALTEVINEMVKNMGDGPERAIFQEAGVEFAIKSAGLGTTVLNNMDKFDLDDPEEIVTVLEAIQNDFNNSNGSAAAGDLAAIVEPQGGFGTTPEFDPSYGNIAKASDVGQAVVILTLALLEQKGVSDVLDDHDVVNFEEWDIGLVIANDGTKDVKVEAGGKPSPEALALAAYLNLIKNDPTNKFDNNPITSGIKDLFNLDSI